MQNSLTFADVGMDNEIAKRIKDLEKMVKNMELIHKKEMSNLVDRLEDLQQENRDLRKLMTNKEQEQKEFIVHCESALRDATVREPSVPFETEGLEIGLSATSVIQGIVNSDNTGVGDRTDSTWTADLEFSKTFENCGLAFCHVEMGQGNGLDDDELNLFSCVNRDNGNSGSTLTVTELYYEAIFFDERLLVTGGKIDPTAYLDDNEIANDETAHFLSCIFRNASTIPFPDNNLGLRVGAEICDGLYLNTGILEADGDFEDIFDRTFGFIQLAYSPDFIERPGTYRVYGWYDTQQHDLLEESISGQPRKREDNHGFGVSFDQEVLDSTTLFGRFGWADESVSNIEYAWSSGLQINGDLWHRENDYFGVAVGQNIPGMQLEKSGATNHKEGQLEVYYNWQIYDHLAISPHLQIVWNPNGVADEDVGAGSDSTVTILGLRSQLDF